jgi:5-methylcytosine-specific restriction protein A
MNLGSTARQMAIGSVKPMQTDMQAGNTERDRLYHSARWKRARLQFLRDHPLCRQCEQRGIIRAAYAVDHVDGHAFRNWSDRFWDQTRWQALCADCHAQKSAEELAAWRRAGEGVADTRDEELEGEGSASKRNLRLHTAGEACVRKNPIIFC